DEQLFKLLGTDNGNRRLPHLRGELCGERGEEGAVRKMASGLMEVEEPSTLTDCKQVRRHPPRIIRSKIRHQAVKGFQRGLKGNHVPLAQAAATQSIKEDRIDANISAD